MRPAAHLMLIYGASLGISSPTDRLMNDTFRFWSALRDPSNGLWCKGIDFQPGTSCDGTGRYGSSYVSAGVGMGLVSDALFAELGLLSVATARARSLQTPAEPREVAAQWEARLLHSLD